MKNLLLPVAIASLARTSQAFPFIPLYHAEEANDEFLPAGLWNGLFNPIDNLFSGFGNFFGFQQPVLISNVVDEKVEIENGYKKVTRTIEQVDEEGRVHSVMTEYWFGGKKKKKFLKDKK